MRARIHSMAELFRITSACRIGLLLIVGCLPLASGGCYFLAGAAAGAGTYAVVDDANDDDDDDDEKKDDSEK